MPCPRIGDTVSDPSSVMAVTVQSSRLRIGSPVLVVMVRSLRRVTIWSPTITVSPPPIGAVTVGVEVGVRRLDGVVEGVDVLVGRRDHCGDFDRRRWRRASAASQSATCSSKGAAWTRPWAM